MQPFSICKKEGSYEYLRRGPLFASRYRCMTLHSSELTGAEPSVDVKSNQEIKESPFVSGSTPALLSVKAFHVMLKSGRSVTFRE